MFWQPAPLFAADLENLIWVVVVVISIIGWIIKQVSEATKGEMTKRERQPPRPAPRQPGVPQRQPNAPGQGSPATGRPMAGSGPMAHGQPFGQPMGQPPAFGQPAPPFGQPGSPFGQSAPPFAQGGPAAPAFGQPAPPPPRSPAAPPQVREFLEQMEHHRPSAEPTPLSSWRAPLAQETRESEPEHMLEGDDASSIRRLAFPELRDRERRRLVEVDESGEPLIDLQAHVDETFSHQLGSLQPMSSATYGATARAGSEVAADILRVLSDPRQVRNVIVLQEVLRRPKF